MCRLTLMNRQAVTSLGSCLNYVFEYLENALGGHGNGVAGLWMDSDTTEIRKGVNFTAAQAAAFAQNYAEQGADWVLFHTRRATSSAIQNRHCHPFQARKLVLAHNGHDMQFAKLGRAIGISDSECIARAWANMRFPLTELTTCSGVFIGFAENHPFVVKGQSGSDLLAAWDEETGSILFASELPSWLIEGVFDQVVSLETIEWFGRDLDPKTLNVQPYHPQATTSFSSYGYWSSGRWVDDPGDPSEEDEALYQELLYEEEEEEDWGLRRQVEPNEYRLRD